MHSLVGPLLQTVFKNLPVLFFTNLPIRPDFLHNTNSTTGFQVKARMTVINTEVLCWERFPGFRSPNSSFIARFGKNRAARSANICNVQSIQWRWSNRIHNSLCRGYWNIFKCTLEETELQKLLREPCSSGWSLTGSQTAALWLRRWKITLFVQSIKMVTKDSQNYHWLPVRAKHPLTPGFVVTLRYLAKY